MIVIISFHFKSLVVKRKIFSKAWTRLYCRLKPSNTNMCEHTGVCGWFFTPRSHFRLPLLRGTDITLRRKRHHVYKFPPLGGKSNEYRPPPPLKLRALPFKQPEGFPCFPRCIKIDPRVGCLRPDLCDPDAYPMFAQRGSDRHVNDSSIRAAKVTASRIYRGSLEWETPFVMSACETINLHANKGEAVGVLNHFDVGAGRDFDRK